jgi:hypothetical protein
MTSRQRLGLPLIPWGVDRQLRARYAPGPFSGRPNGDVRPRALCSLETLISRCESTHVAGSLFSVPSPNQNSWLFKGGGRTLAQMSPHCPSASRQAYLVVKREIDRDRCPTLNRFASLFGRQE